MKRIITSSSVLVALALGTSALAQSFTAGNLVIFRIGGNASGVNGPALTNRGNYVWLDEYTPGTSSLTDVSTFVRSHMMPTTYFGANSPLIGNGTAFGEGLITCSVDGRFILVCGYGTDTNAFSSGAIQGTFGTEVPRVVGLVDGNGHIDTTTTLTNQLVDNSELRSAASVDGTNLYFSGSSGGARYTLRNTFLGVATNLPSIDNIRQLNIFSNQLYFTTINSTNGILTITNTVAGVLVTTSTNGTGFTGLIGVTNIIPTFTSPYGFAFFTLKAGGTDLDTLYIADAGTNSSSGSVRKFSLVGSAWSNDGSIRASGAVGLVGQKDVVGSQTNVHLWIMQNTATLTGNDNLLYATDSSGYHGAASGNANINAIATSDTAVHWRGIAFAPVGGETFPTGPQNLSAGPLLDYLSTASTGCSATETDKYSIANLGTGTMTWQANCDSNWVSFSPASGSLGAGGSVSVAAFFNGNVTSLPAGTNLTSITFTNTTAGSSLGTQTRRVQLVMKDQSVTPTLDYTPSGIIGGPFSPATNTFTVFNGSTTINLVVATNAGASWLSISPTNVPTMGGCSSTNITVSVIPSVATNLAAGNYSTVLIFSNATAGTVIATRNVQLSVGGLFFCDDFSTFIQGANLVPQQGWTQFNGTDNEPVVHDGQVFVRGIGATGLNADEPFKNIPVTGTGNVFIAMVMTVTSAPPSSIASPSRSVCTFQSQNAGGFAGNFLSARDTGTVGNTKFVFCTRNNGIPANTNIFGTTPLDYNTPYRVIVQCEAGNTNTYVYVNPVSSTLDTNTAYVKMHLVSGSDLNIGSIQIGNQFSGGSSQIPGISFAKMCVTTNFADAYNDITTVGPTDPFSNWQTFYFGSTTNANAAGTADPDADGMINTNEFLAGFDPTDNAAYLHIINIARTGGTNVTVSYLGASGDNSYTGGPASRTNVLEFTTGAPPSGSYSNNFVSTGLTNILSGGSGSGSLASFVDTNGASGPTRYYRVRVLVP